MTDVALDFYGHIYDKAIPAFVNVDDLMVYHRATHRLIRKSSLTAAMTAAGYTAPGGEIGDAVNWLIANTQFRPVASGGGGGGGGTPTGVTFEADLEGSIGRDGNFYALGGTPPYHFNFGDGTPEKTVPGGPGADAKATTSHTYAANGTYTIVVKDSAVPPASVSLDDLPFSGA